MSPVYGPEDLIYTSVSRKRKIRCLSRPAKRLATGTEVSDADDEDAGVEAAAPVARDVAPACPSPTASPRPGPAESSTSATRADRVSTEVPIPIVPSSQESSSQSGSDRPGPIAELEKTAKAALHNLESATGTHVSHAYRGTMAEHCLALGKRDALENFRQACCYWRRQDGPQRLGVLALEGPVTAVGPVLPSQHHMKHSALDQFSRAYHTAQATIVQRAVLDVLYRAHLAHLHDVYINTLAALSHFAVQEKDVRGSRPRHLFDDDVRRAAADQMFWACYPHLEGSPRSSHPSLDRKFRTTLQHAGKWHALRAEFTIGMLALVPRGANTWFEKVSFKDQPVYFQLIRAVNPVSVVMAETLEGRVQSLWNHEAPPERRLRLEYLETVDEISFKANPLRLLEEVDVGYVRSSHELQVGRAVTVPVGVDENDLAALEAAFSSQSQGQDSYHVPSSVYHDMDFLGG